MRIRLRHGDGGEGSVGIIDAALLWHLAEKRDGVIYSGASGLDGHPLVDQSETLGAKSSGIRAGVAASAESRVGFADRMIGEREGVVGRFVFRVVAAIIGTRKDCARGIDGDEVAEEFELRAARFDIGDGAAKLKHVAKDEIDRHELIEIEGDAGADEGGDAEGEPGFVHAAIGPDGSSDGKAEVTQS